MKKILFLSILVLGFSQEIPKPVGHVNDFAGILPKEMSDRLEAKLRAYKTETSNEVSIVTVKSLGGMSVEDYTIRLAKAWGVGNKKKDNGVVFLIAPKERRCRIEVGYGLEPKLTDIQAKRIIEDAVIPKFKQGQMPAGIEAGTDSILLTLTGKAPPAAAPVKGEPVSKPEMVLLIILGVCLLVVVVVAVVIEGGVKEWSSSSGLGPIATGAAMGGLMAASSLPRSTPKPSPPPDDDDTSRRSSSSSSSYDHHDSGSSFDSFGGFGGGSFGGGGASGSW